MWRVRKLKRGDNPNSLDLWKVNKSLKVEIIFIHSICEGKNKLKRGDNPHSLDLWTVKKVKKIKKLKKGGDNLHSFAMWRVKKVKKGRFSSFIGFVKGKKSLKAEIIFIHSICEG